MMKKLSLRMRLTLLSALVMASVAVILTSMFLFGADRHFRTRLRAEDDVSAPGYYHHQCKKRGSP